MLDSDLSATPAGPLLQTTWSQEALANAYATVDTSVAQHLISARRITGPVREDRVNATFRRLQRQHTVLDARYVFRGGRVAGMVSGDVREIPIAVFDISGTDDTTLEERTRAILLKVRDERFNLDTGPLCRVVLVRLSAEQFVAAVVIHHSICDAWSLYVLWRDFARVYAALTCAREPQLPALPVSFAEHTAWLRETLESSDGQRQWSYWLERLKGIPQPFWLPRDPPAVRAETPDRTIRTVRLTGETLARLRRLAGQEKASLRTVLLAVYSRVLASWSAQCEVAVAVIHLGRGREELMELVGCLVQIWVLRVSLQPGHGIRDLLRQVRDSSLDAEDNLLVPFVRTKPVLAQSAVEKPLTQITFNYIPQFFSQDPGWASAGLTEEAFEVDALAPILEEGRAEKLAMNWIEDGDGVRGFVRYLPRWLGAASIEVFWGRFLEELDAAVQLV